MKTIFAISFICDFLQNFFYFFIHNISKLVLISRGRLDWFRTFDWEKLKAFDKLISLFLAKEAR